jgi:NAD(P)H-hydrate repair Nnr-like enzyme with NAD(P)H-hydrate dehydratase domain
MTPLPAFVRQDGPPLYPNVLFNRPVTRHGAGRLVIAGGYATEFSLPTAIHQLALAAGLGECQVILPDSLARLVGGAPDTLFVPSSPSGSLGTEALGRIVELAEEADALALGASLSGHSHTSMLMERVVQAVARPIVAFADVLGSLQHHVRLLTDRTDCLLIVTMPEVFKLAGQLGIPIAIRRDGGLMNKLEIVHDLAAASACHYVVYGSEIIVAAGGDLIVTPVNYRLSLLPAAYYGVMATGWLQNSSRRREGLATSAYLLREASRDLGATDRPSTAAFATKLSHILEDAEAA